MKKYPFEVGDIVVPADGSNYRGIITFISEAENIVRHTCLRTDATYEKSYWGFMSRYMTEQDSLAGAFMSQWNAT